ncbi:MAG: tRNA (guanosine(37)-N1)-methyltransferase TrmD [Chthonomonas sp.]|nr:tRNA (guanosine(37)-N1)-methyltransferase TrmD [Chthonomonas sp.]
MLRFDFVSLFPEMIRGVMGESMAARAQANGLIEVHTSNPRDFATDKHRTVDDRPFGGSPGMLLLAPIMEACLASLSLREGDRVVFPDPRGRLFSEASARSLAEAPRVVFVCGHYEGIDERIVEKYATDLLSLGDFVLTGGELPSLVIADAIMRKVPGVLGDSASLDADSHASGLLSSPQFAKPREHDGVAVPEELHQGNHGEIERWHRRQALRLTRANRPDLFCQAPLGADDLNLLE